MQEQIDILLDVLKSDDKALLSKSRQRTVPAPETLSQFLNHRQPGTEIGQIAQTESGCIYVLNVDMFLLKTGGDNLLIAFHKTTDYRAHPSVLRNVCLPP